MLILSVSVPYVVPDGEHETVAAAAVSVYTAWPATDTTRIKLLRRKNLERNRFTDIVFCYKCFSVSIEVIGIANRQYIAYTL